MHAIFLLLALTVPAAQDGSSSIDNREKPIVVIGESLRDSESALNSCIARKCPTKEDIAATLRHAENLFVAGDYKQARQTLQSSRSRNYRSRKQYPEDVADLLHANALIAAHLGESQAYLSNTLDSLDSLKAGLSPDSPKVLASRISLGDSYLRLGRIEDAAEVYRAVAKRANHLQLPNIEGHAQLRLARMYTALSDLNGGTYDESAKFATKALLDNKSPAFQPFVNAARVLDARRAARRGDKAAIDQLIATYPPNPSGSIPTLVYSPQIKLPEPSAKALSGGSPLHRTALSNFEKQWVDIGFWVAPDGTVTDAGILRQSETLEDHWIPPVLKAINGRRYAPTAVEANDPGTFRIERYTYTSNWTANTGSRIRVRDVNPKIEMLDLSPVAPAQTSGR